MDYTQISIFCEDAYHDLLIYELSTFGNISFTEEENVLDAFFVRNNQLTKEICSKLAFYKDKIIGFDYKINFVEHQNWNQVWEKSYQPAIIAEKYIISAPFHSSSESNKTNIIIKPAMAFGTGHHATTSMMIELMEIMSFKDKTVADFGCGTSVLSIIAEKKGASSIIAIDNDPDSIKSSRENLKLNNCNKIQRKKGSGRQIKSGNFDIILANINLNTLLKFKKTLAESLNNGAFLICSGFRNEDISVMTTEFLKLSLSVKKIRTENEWAALLMQKEN